MIANRTTVKAFLERLGHRVALVARKPLRRNLPNTTVIWPVDQGDETADIACGLSADYGSVYANLNPLHRAMHDVSPEPWRSVCDTMIARRARVLVDVDAHDCPKDEARRQFDAIRRQVGEPLIAADTGNGFALIYTCDLPNDERSKQQLRRYLAELKAQFNCVDAGVFTASRLCRVVGTPNLCRVSGLRIPTTLIAND
jgi:hypothetical protein